MGLFSKKPKQISINQEQSDANKKRMREIFNQAVEDGASYKLLFGTYSTAQIERGLILDTRISTFYSYILGWNELDNRVALIEVNADLSAYSEPNYIAIQEIKATNYYKKLQQIWFIYKDGPRYGVGLNIEDCSDSAMYCLKSLDQSKEREEFLDFFERYSQRLMQMGNKFKMWKR